MYQMIRRIVVAASLALALLLVSSAPSLAAQARKPAPAHGLSLVDQAWAWLESLLGGVGGTAPTVQRKTVMTTPVPPPPPPEQGPAIDPNGVK